LLHSREAVAFGFPDFVSNGTLVSLARSGDSPESAGTISLAQRMFPKVSHLVIVCNEHGRIAQSPGAKVITLDPRTNDRGLAMTASFSNLVLAGMAVNHLQLLRKEISPIADRVRAFMPTLEAEAQRLGTRLPERVVILTPPDLAHWGRRPL
jgi:tagatose-6-phosphate ketose/aldose isomerase